MGSSVNHTKLSRSPERCIMHFCYIVVTWKTSNLEVGLAEKINEYEETKKLRNKKISRKL